jgi:hypothetical protein
MLWPVPGAKQRNVSMPQNARFQPLLQAVGCKPLLGGSPNFLGLEQPFLFRLRVPFRQLDDALGVEPL